VRGGEGLGPIRSERDAAARGPPSPEGARLREWGVGSGVGMPRMASEECTTAQPNWSGGKWAVSCLK
jgi:hypothetical protein